VEEALEKARGELKGMAVREEEMMETSSRTEQNSKEEMGKKASDDGSGCSRGEMWRDVEEVVGKNVEYVKSKDGRLIVVGIGEGGGVEGDKIQLDEWLGDRGDEEVVIVEDELNVSECGRGESMLNVSARSCEGGDMFSFLDNIDNVGSDEAAELKRGEDLKRKRDTGGFVVNSKGLIGTPGWEEREAREKGDVRWKREVIVEGGVKLEGMPLPEDYRLGLEKRGEELNNSSRTRNNMGTNRKALFPRGD